MTISFQINVPKKYSSLCRLQYYLFRQANSNKFATKNLHQENESVSKKSNRTITFVVEKKRNIYVEL